MDYSRSCKAKFSYKQPANRRTKERSRGQLKKLIIHKVFTTLCLSYKVVSVDYFMDVMQDWEVYDIYESLDYSDVQQWEQIRWLGYLIAQINCKKTLTITDLLKFKWDSLKNTSSNEISSEDIERLKEKAKQISKIISIK